MHNGTYMPTAQDYIQRKHLIVGNCRLPSVIMTCASQGMLPGQEDWRSCLDVRKQSPAEQTAQGGRSSTVGAQEAYYGQGRVTRLVRLQRGDSHTWLSCLGNTPVDLRVEAGQSLWTSEKATFLCWVCKNECVQNRLEYLLPPLSHRRCRLPRLWKRRGYTCRCAIQRARQAYGGWCSAWTSPAFAFVLHSKPYIIHLTCHLLASILFMTILRIGHRLGPCDSVKTLGESWEESERHMVALENANRPSMLVRRSLFEVQTWSCSGACSHRALFIVNSSLPSRNVQVPF